MNDAPAFLLSFSEVVVELGRTEAATRMWLSRHGLRAARRIAVGERATRALYDGAEVLRHANGEAASCNACAPAHRLLS